MTPPFQQQPNQIHLFVTADYELFLGKNTGTVQACILEPAEKLAAMAERYKKSIIFFVDAMYLHALKLHAEHFAGLAKEFADIQEQLRNLLRRGHHVQLHLHPQWLDSYYAEGRWQFKSLDRYKLTDLSKDDDPTRWDTILGCITQGKLLLERIAEAAIPGYKITSFRAGGLCVQPFDTLGKALKRNGITIDSSVAPRLQQTFGPRAYDFSRSPKKRSWRFSIDPCVEVTDGEFTEMPVMTFSAHFFNQLRIRVARTFAGDKTKTWGDGVGLPQAKRDVLSQLLPHPALLTYDYWDRFTILSEIEFSIMKGWNTFTLLGHPKYLSPFGLAQLEGVLSHGAKQGWL